MERYKPYIIQVMITTIIVLIGMIIVQRNQPPTLVKVDLLAITSHYTDIMKKGVITSNSTDIAKVSQVVKANLEPIVKDYAKEHNAVVIQSQALISSNIPDITDEITNELDRRLK